ncbi:MAG: phospholipase D/nuclease [Lentinula lateritia]|nr:MAG: phospholipase D/nuclease [Lentinula lateritia]
MGDHVAVEKLDGLEVLNEDSVSFNGFLNPNRRRDDPEEKAADALRAEINASNRFDSFGRRTFRKRPLSFICAPPAKHSEWSLDKGVKVYVVVYKEVSQTMSMSSKHAKTALEQLNPPGTHYIQCMRHPEHIGAEKTVEFWSHHEKVVVVDNHRLCDTHNHPLADVHLSSHALVRVSQDYNNARVICPVCRGLCQQLTKHSGERKMPWHDVHMSPSGPVVLDIKRKYRNNESSIARYPHREVWHVMGRKCEQRWHDWLGGQGQNQDPSNDETISATKKGDVVTNEIAGALAHRVIRAAREGRNFEIVVVIPEVPAFSGNVKDESSFKIIMAAQYRTITINWGGASIYETIRKAGYELMDYIRFCHLRAYDRINAPQHSGVSLHQAQVALARKWLGSQVTSATDSCQITKEGVVITEKTPVREEAVAVPDTEEEEEAKQIIRRFERAAEAVRGDEDVSDNVVQHILSDKTGLEQYKWLGMGSANLNDRSQKRDSDSEIALVAEDTDLVQSTMDGEPYIASRTPTCMMTTPIPYMRSAPCPNPDRLNSQEDQMVTDPLLTNTINLWTDTARQNREIFTEVFRPVPSNLVRIGQGMIDMYPKTKTGHVVPGIPLQRVKDRLSKVKGALVEAPIDFLIDDKGFVEGPDWAG